MMKRDLKNIMLLSIFLWNLQLFAQKLPKITVAIDTTELRIGEQLRLDLQVKTDTLSFVDFPEQENFGDLEIVTQTPTDTLEKKPQRLLKKTYFLTQWDSGRYVIPQIPLKIKDSVFLTDSLQVHFRTVAVDTSKQQLYEYKDILKVDNSSGRLSDHKNSYWWLLPVLLLISLIYFLYRKRKNILEKQKKQSVYEQISQELEQLRQEKLWLRNKIDLHYFRLTDLLKDYIEKRLKNPAKELLSSQIIEKLKAYRFETNKHIDSALLERLEQMLKRADLAKFAKLEPAAPDIDNDFEIAKDFINHTNAVLLDIEHAKAMSEAKELEKKKARRKKTYIILAVVLGLLLAIAGTGYYYFGKSELFYNLQENIKSPEWVYNEYGGKPALALVTPHVLNAYDLSEIMESSGKSMGTLKKIVDELSAYTDENIIKGYVILEMNIDFKETAKLPENIDKMLLQSILQYAQSSGKANHVKITNEETFEGGTKFTGQADIKTLLLNQTETFEFRMKIFTSSNHIRVVSGIYKKGDKKNMDLTERVLSSAELKN